MPEYTFDQAVEKSSLLRFFSVNGANIHDFGEKVAQTFEAATFAAVIRWYRGKGWSVEIRNPRILGRESFRLKFSTRGKPGNFTYVKCAKDGRSCQIRHQIRVETWHNRNKRSGVKMANVVCDVAVVEDDDYSWMEDYRHVPRAKVITFGEAKHMSAYAELICGFIGLVHELQPKRLKRIRGATYVAGDHMSPFLHLSGSLFSTAEGCLRTIVRRRYDIDVYHANNKIA